MSELQRNQSTHRFGHDYTQGDGEGELEIPVEGKQDHKNQHYGQRADKIHLRPGFEELAVFTSPGHSVTLRERHSPFYCCLTVSHRPLQIPPLNAVLHSDVAGVIFAINKRRTVSLRNVGQLAERNLLPI